MKKLFCVLLALLTMCLCFCSCGSDSGDDDSRKEKTTADPVEERKALLEGAYEECGSGPYIDFSSDHTSLEIDTNPYNSEYNNYYENDAIQAIFSVNEFLGLPDSLTDKMSNTRALDGMQSQNCGDFTVTWTYHPDNGLEVIYEINFS